MRPRRPSPGVAALVVIVGLLASVGVVLAASGVPLTSRGLPPTTSSAPSTSSSAARVVVGLGDSVTAGDACDCVPFIDRYAAALAPRPGTGASAAGASATGASATGTAPAAPAARAVNLGESGLTTSGLADQLAGDEVAQQALASADTVVVTIGANDLGPLIARWQSRGCPGSCSAPATAAMAAGLGEDLRLVRDQMPSGSRLLVTDYWNVFEDGDVAMAHRGAAFAGWSDRITRAANAAICAEAHDVGATCVDLYVPFLGQDGRKDPTGLLADDGDHPNAAGHAAIAAALVRAAP